MTSIDYTVLLIYLAGVFLVGILFASKNKSSSDMFAAGGKSPWWASGLSGFMTMFSANTFVVWGGIAYERGLVAVLINLMYGLAALLVGYFVAGRWRRMGVQTPAEYIQLRFGNAALHFFTWFMTVFKMLTTAGALYAMGRILVALMPIPDGWFIQDPETGNLSLSWAIILLSSIVVIYTMIGGLWAVLMTDVLQFIVLNLAVLFVIPLVLIQVGGVGAAIEGMGNTVVDEQGRTMLSPIAGDYTMMFLVGWLMIHFFMIGAEWAFVQRFICVKDAKAARMGAYLFGGLYLVSPLLWLMPPLIWRVVHPIPEGATGEEVLKLKETAYIDACKSVLPVGMIGLMFAAMFSATASMVSSQLNVFSGVMTNDIYKPLVKKASGAQLLWVGRIFTVVLGVLLIGIALSYLSLGGAEKVIIKSTEAVVVALLAPTVWGLFSRKVGVAAVWWTAGVGMVAGLFVRLWLAKDGWLTQYEAFAPAADMIQENMKVAETISGVILPVAVLCVVQILSKNTNPGYERITSLPSQQDQDVAESTGPADKLPALVVGYAVGICGVLMLGLLPFNSKEDAVVLVAFAAVTLVISGIILFFTLRQTQPTPEDVKGA